MRLFAFRPRYIINGQITTTKVAAVANVKRKNSPASNLGDLDALPLELLHAIFAMLDFKTLSHIQRTCLRGIAVVESLPQYRDMIEHAPKALAALGQTQLLRHHSAAALHAALLTSECQCCGDYGPFLHLPTARRCCFFCLENSTQLWVIPVSQAKSCFNITNSQLKHLPVMLSIPGAYQVRGSVSRNRKLRLICVGTARELVTQEHGDFMSELRAKRTDGRISVKDFYQYRAFRSSPLSSSELKLRPLSSRENSAIDEYCGMASVPFPHVTASLAVDQGYWCLGCQLTLQEWYRRTLSHEDVSHLIPSPCTRRVDDQLRDLTRRARSSAELLEHLPQCIRGRSLETMEPSLSCWRKM